MLTAKPQLIFSPTYYHKLFLSPLGIPVPGAGVTDVDKPDKRHHHCDGHEETPEVRSYARERPSHASGGARETHSSSWILEGIILVCC